MQTYATPDGEVPTAGEEASYDGAIGFVWNVGNGSEEINGTYDMMGNVWEWNESANSAPDDSVTENRVIRGGSYGSDESNLRSSHRGNYGPTSESYDIGFRVAAIPEPLSIALIGLTGGCVLGIRRFFMI